MERSQLFDLMGELKLYGMKAAFDEIMATAVKRQHEPQRIVGDVLNAEISEKQAPFAGGHPGLALRGRGEDDRHRLGMDGADLGVGLARQKPEELVLPLDRVGLGAALAVPRRPDAGELGQRAATRRARTTSVFCAFLDGNLDETFSNRPLRLQHSPSRTSVIQRRPKSASFLSRHF
jgi:hypothetical protein